MTRFFPQCLALGTALALGCLPAANRPASTSAPAVAAPDRASASLDARAAVERALPFLARDGAWWLAGGKDVPGRGGCITCHHVALALWSHSEAERAGVDVTGDTVVKLRGDARRFFTRSPDEVKPVGTEQLLLGVRASVPDQPEQQWRRQLQRRLVADQESNGSWQAGGQFPAQRRPAAESDAVATMWALLALDSIDPREPAPVDSRTRALAWLGRQPEGVSNEWLALRLLLERRLGNAAPAQALLTRLLERQRPDGGWSWLAPPTAAARPRSPRPAAVPAGTSDALSTGQILYALRLAGLGPEHPAASRASDYLLGTQRPDGTWSVPSELVSKKGRRGTIDYVYRYWGTAWATIGLARMLPRKS
jgi:hypothetical protein